MPDPLDVVRQIGHIGMGRPPINPAAFEKAREQFGHTYLDAYRPVLHDDREQAHDEAQTEALEAFLATYLSEVAR